MKVVIVDDEVYAVKALINRIDWAALGFDPPLAAHSMAQTQNVFLSVRIDLMLCDIEMPQGSGLELFEWVKAYYPSTECIFVTCHDEYSYLRAALQLGSCDYILKPVDYEQLNTTLSEVTRRIAQRQTHQAVEQLKLDAPLTVDAPPSDNPYINQIVTYITDHLTESISISDIAEQLHLHPQYTMRLFKKTVGCSILQYITAKRITLAVRYLEETNIAVTDVAILCGFDNYSYFTRIFKRFTNETPVAFRKSSKTGS